jgi:uncharacterized protein
VAGEKVAGPRPLPGAAGYRQIRGIGIPFDLLVAAPSDLEKHKDNIGLIYQTILTDGKEIYAA